MGLLFIIKVSSGRFVGKDSTQKKEQVIASWEQYFMIGYRLNILTREYFSRSFWSWVFLASEMENTWGFPAQRISNGKRSAGVAVRPPGPDASEGMVSCVQGPHGVICVQGLGIN